MNMILIRIVGIVFCISMCVAIIAIPIKIFINAVSKPLTNEEKESLCQNKN